MRLTLRELVAAVEAKRLDQWEHTAHVLATLINVNRAPDSPAVNADDLNPFKRKRRNRRRSIFTRDVLNQEFKRLSEKKPPRRVSASQIQVIEKDDQ